MAASASNSSDNNMASSEVSHYGPEEYDPDHQELHSVQVLAGHDHAAPDAPHQEETDFEAVLFHGRDCPYCTYLLSNPFSLEYPYYSFTQIYHRSELSDFLYNHLVSGKLDEFQTEYFYATRNGHSNSARPESNSELSITRWIDVVGTSYPFLTSPPTNVSGSFCCPLGSDHDFPFSETERGRKETSENRDSSSSGTPDQTRNLFCLTMAPAAAESRPTYQKDEKALCFHGELLYDAKVLEVRRQDPKDKHSPYEYRVHYKGWKNTWDDWVPQDRLRKLTEDNRELAATLRRDARPAPKSSTKPTSKNRRGPLGSDRGSEERNSSVPAGRGTKRGRDNDIEKVGTLKISLSRFVTLDDGIRDLKDTKTPQSDPEGPQPSKPKNTGQEFPTLHERTRLMKPPETDEAPASPIVTNSRIRSRGSLTMDDLSISNGSIEKQTSRESKERPILGGETGKLPRSAKQPMRAAKGSAALDLGRDASPESELGLSPTVSRIPARDPPPDEPEYISMGTFRSKSNIFFAPLIGGTTMEERSAIERELQEAGKISIPEKYHPGYVKARQDPFDLNRMAFFEGQDPNRKLVIAGVAKDPVEIDPPGSGGPFDALKFPDRLVETLNRNGPKNLYGWDAKALKNIPKHLMERISGAVLAEMPSEVISRLPTSIQDKLPEDAPFFASLPSNRKFKRPNQRAGHNATKKSKAPIINPPLSSGTSSLTSAENIEDPQAYTRTPTQEETFHARPSIRIPVPDLLKNLLVDDWENVTKSLLLVPLPSQAPANFIIDSYFNEEKGNRRLGSTEADLLEEFCAGMKTYFEKSVGKILLYRFERPQLAEIRKLWESGKYPDWDGKGPGDAYGAEHLTRMIVNMPEMISQTNMDIQSVNRLREEISKFCTWLARNSQKYFCAKYEKPSQEYIENAR